MSPVDATLLKRWTEYRDAEAFNDLVSRHADMVYATCKRVLGNPADAEEVAQECFLKLATGGERIRTSLGGWLHSVATSLAISRIRSDARRHRREQALADHTPHAVEPCWDDLQQYVDEAIAELPEELRDPLVQHFLQRKTHDEITRQLGVSRSAVTKRIAARQPPLPRRLFLLECAHGNRSTRRRARRTGGMVVRRLEGNCLSPPYAQVAAPPDVSLRIF